MGVSRSAYRVLVRKLGGKIPIGRAWLMGAILCKLELKVIRIGEGGPDSSG